MSGKHVKNRGSNSGSPTKTPAPGILIRSLLSDFLSPRQIASLDVNWDKEYGMDNEVIRVFADAHKFSKTERKLMPFDSFKLINCYLSIPNLNALVGCVQLPECEIDYPYVLSKSEKIRGEVYENQLRIRRKANPDRSLLAVLDYILERTNQNFPLFELVSYEMRAKKVETVLDKFMDSVPKKDLAGHPGPQEHIVSVQALLWPDRGYVISRDVYQRFPNLESFFGSPIGTKFHASFMDYLACQFPNMQEKMLDHVNSFTNRYFEWLSRVIEFESSLAPEMRWKYTPLEAPLCHEKRMPIRKLVLRFVVSKEDGVVKRKFFFLDEVRFVFLQLRKLGVDPDGINLTPLLPLDGPSPLIHRVADVGSIDYFVALLKNVLPDVLDFVDVVTINMCSSWMTDFKALPIVSPFNAHCIRAIDAFKRIVEVLVDEVAVGRRIPFTFHPLVQLIKKMEVMFPANQMFKTMVNRKEAHDLIKEASDLRGKYNGKLKTPKGRLGLLKEDSTEPERMDAFLATFRKFTPFYNRHSEPPLSPESRVTATPPGEPSLVAIHHYLVDGIEKEDDGDP